MPQPIICLLHTRYHLQLDGSLWLSSECREFGVMAKSFVYQNAYLQRWFRAARHPEDQQEQQRLQAYLSRRV
jgi:hypothetical protein